MRGGLAAVLTVLTVAGVPASAFVTRTQARPALRPALAMTAAEPAPLPETVVVPDEEGPLVVPAKTGPFAALHRFEYRILRVIQQAAPRDATEGSVA